LEKEDPPAPAVDESVREIMAHRLKTKEGKNKYKKRKETVEPVFGIIKSVMVINGKAQILKSLI
jgi:hypothetical protein